MSKMTMYGKKEFIRFNLKLILNIWVYQQESIWHLTGSTAKVWLITCINKKTWRRKRNSDFPDKTLNKLKIKSLNDAQSDS